jgi:hypothetical protein
MLPYSSLLDIFKKVIFQIYKYLESLNGRSSPRLEWTRKCTNDAGWGLSLNNRSNQGAHETWHHQPFQLVYNMLRYFKVSFNVNLYVDKLFG